MSPAFQPLGRVLVLIGLVLILFGVVLLMAPKLPWIGRLPGDILIQRERFSFYFPLASCLLASLLLSFLFWMFGRFR